MKPLVFLTILYMAIFMGTAQAQNYQMDPYTLEGQGNLITLRMQIGDKKAKLYVVGKESAVINLKKDEPILKITAFAKDGSRQDLRFQTDRGYYTVDVPGGGANEPYRYEVKTRVRDQEENIRLKIKQQH